MKITFSFGKNWMDFVKNFVNEERLNIALDSLLKYLPPEEYKNKVFMDVGCGSGIFSFSAIRLGCSKVISFDIDPLSIKATNYLKEKFYYLLSKNFEWEIFQGDVLDKSLISKYSQKIDIVYSWGVLHHAGKMWEAIKNVSYLVKPNGYLILAIYNKAPSSEFWLKVKKFYNSSPVSFNFLW